MKEELFRNLLYLEDFNNLKIYFDKGLTDEQLTHLNNKIHSIKNKNIIYYLIDNEKIFSLLMESIFFYFYYKNDIEGVKKIVSKGVSPKLISIIKDIIHEENNDILKYLFSMSSIKDYFKIK